MTKLEGRNEEVAKAGNHGGVEGAAVKRASAAGVAKAGKLNADGKDVTPEQMELSRVRIENTRLS